MSPLVLNSWGTSKGFPSILGRTWTVWLDNKRVLIGKFQGTWSGVLSCTCLHKHYLSIRAVFNMTSAVFQIDYYGRGKQMIIRNQEFHVNGLTYTIRSAMKSDAKNLSELRLQIDGETENLDRERGEGFIDEPGFENIIHTDTVSPRNLFLVAVTDDRIVGFSRCEGTYLKRFSHKVEFGVCILKGFWGYGIGKNLLKASIVWADSNDIKKIILNVLETNTRAIELYEMLGFEIEGILRNDRILSDGEYYDTIVMGRFID